MKEKIRLFVDMDGTLATFNPIAKIEMLYEKEYFLKLPPMLNMVEAIKSVAESAQNIDVYILSSCLDNEFAKSEKNAWLDKYLPSIDKEHRIFCKYGLDKSSYILEKTNIDVLLDDYTKNLNEWHGIGIKILNGINDTNKSWNGQRISSFLEPNILSYTIKNQVLSAMPLRDRISKQKELAITKSMEQTASKKMVGNKHER